MVIKLTPEEQQLLIVSQKVTRGIKVTGEDGKSITITVNIRRPDFSHKKRAEMTGEERRSDRGRKRQIARNAQERTLKNIGYEPTQGRTHKRWTGEEKREYINRRARGESDIEIALGMNRTWKSIRSAAQRPWARA